MRQILLLAVVSFSLAFTVPAVAQVEPPVVRAPLADRIPADALVYVGWAGAEDVKQLYAVSHAEAVLGASNLAMLFEQTLPKLGEIYGRQNEELRPLAKFAGEIAPILFRHPTAIAFGGVDWASNPEQPLPRILMICDAGEEATDLRVKLTELFQMVRKVELVTLMDVKDGVVYLSLGWQKLDLAMLEEDPATSLLRDGRFTSAMGGLMESPAAALFIDVPGLARFAEEANRHGPKGEDGVREFQTFMDATGLRGLGSIAAASGFADRQYVTSAFIETRGARTGLLALLESEPIDAALLRSIPGDAGFVAAGRFDAAKLLQAVRNAIIVTQPDQAGQFEQGLKFISMLVGADIENDLLNSLGTSWAAYTAPATGDTALGLVAINQPSQPERVESALKNLSLSLVSLINQQARQQGQPFRLAARNVDTPQGRIDYLDLPLVAPSWSTSEGLVYFGLYPHSIASARMGGAAEESFADGEAWRQVQQLAGGRAVRSFTYLDAPRYTGRAYAQLGALVQVGSGALSGFGESQNIPTRFPPMTLPPYALLRQHLTPAITVTTVDERGLHLRAVEAFPGSCLLGAMGMQ